MNKKVNVFLGLAIVVMSTIAIFVLFAPLFYNPVVDEPYAGKEMGSVFANMFWGNSVKDVEGFKPVGLFIFAFVALCLSWLLGFASCVMSGKKSAIVFAADAVLLAFAGFVFLLGKQVYCGVNGSWSNPQFNESLTIGAGAICSLIFAWIGALFAGYGAFSNLKAA